MGVVEEEAILGDYPSILNVGLRSFILIIIYFLLAKIYQQFPALGFSTKSKGGLNQGQKPNDISYTGAYKTIVITIQEVYTKYIFCKSLSLQLMLTPKM